MDLEITGRGTQVTQKLRQQAEEALARVEKVLGPKCMAKVVLICEKNHCEAEVTVRYITGDFSSHTSAKEIGVALKDALDKVELQAVKARKKVVTTRHHPGQSAAGSIRLQSDDVDVDVKQQTGKAVAGIDDVELHEEQDVQAA